ncbi:MAG: tetratricopeptide repeat protein [Bacteroidia bacterium]
MNLNIYCASFLMLMASLLSSCQQNEETGKHAEEVYERLKNEEVERLKTVYRKSMEYGDGNTAIYALQNLMLIDSQYVDYSDTLATLYFGNGKYQAALAVTDEALEKEPENLEMLEIAAMANTFMGENDEALNIFRELYRLSGNAQYLYRIAIAQISDDDFEGARTSIDSLFAHPGIETDSVTVPVGQNHSQEVPLKAAALNLRGFYFGQRQEMEKAREFFLRALAVDPEFVLPQGALREMSGISGRGE